MATMVIELTRGFQAIIDEEQYEAEHVCRFRDGYEWRGRPCDRNWHTLHKNHTNYAVNTLHIAKRTREMRLHRLLMNAPSGVLVDHHDGNGLNNRLSNLRLATNLQNSRNRKSAKGACPLKGVTLHKQTGKYEAYIRVNGVKKHLGLFSDPESAARAYDIAALKHFGEFANPNFQTAACRV